MKELLLLRHGKSDWSINASDFDRPLKKRGTRNAKQIGVWLSEQQLQPDLVISSPANRALSTAEIVASEMSIPVHSIQTDNRIYGADLDDLLLILSEIPSTIDRVMLVGHNPDLEELVEYFVPDIQIAPDGKLVPTATLVHLQLDQEWDSIQDIHKVVSYKIQRPRDLPIHNK
jgi:phosphohistidine phosphatase